MDDAIYISKTASSQEMWAVSIYDETLERRNLICTMYHPVVGDQFPVVPQAVRLAACM